MVSLADETTRSGGQSAGFFFDSDLRSDTDDLLSEPSLRQPYKRVPVRFHKLRTVFTTPLLIILLIGQVVAAFVLPHILCHRDNLRTTKANSYSVLVYCHFSIWLIYILVDRFARRDHHKSRQQGYLDFFRKTCYLRRIPLMVLSGGNALLLVMTVILFDYCNEICGHHSSPHNLTTTVLLPTTTAATSFQPTDATATSFQTTGTGGGALSSAGLVSTEDFEPGEEKCCPHIPLSHSNWLQAALTVEALILAPVLLKYLVKTIRFNRSQPQPDVMEQDLSTTSSWQAQNSPMEMGFRDDTCVDDLMEKQAEMIRYLKERNASLGKQVMELTSQINVVN